MSKSCSPFLQLLTQLIQVLEFSYPIDIFILNLNTTLKLCENGNIYDTDVYGVILHQMLLLLYNILCKSDEIQQSLICACSLPITDQNLTNITSTKSRISPEAREYMMNWLMSHKEHPYPTLDEKQEIMTATNLQIRQVEDWFINARRRYLPKKKKMEE